MPNQLLDIAVWHGSYQRAKDRRVPPSDIYTAALLGDDQAVKRYLAEDPSRATKSGGPRNWDPLTYLCFSVFLQHEPHEGFVRAAEALLDAGADPNTGFWDDTHTPHPERESVLYGAAGVAFHPGLTKLLLDRGAEPNDAEVPYHSPETYDNRALQVLLESGKLTPQSKATMLVRKADFHDLEGMRLVLSHNADPNFQTSWKNTPLQHAIQRDNALAMIELLLDHGADPKVTNARTGLTAVAMAARRGRRDVLDAFARRDIPIDPRDLELDMTQGGRLLAEFAGNGNTAGVRELLEAGVPVDALYVGDAYFGIAPDSTALHVAAWRARPETVRALIAHGACLNVRDAHGRTPLMLAIKACVDSYWMNRRTPESVAALLSAGCSLDGVSCPTGYEEVDVLLRRYPGMDGTRAT